MVAAAYQNIPINPDPDEATSQGRRLNVMVTDRGERWAIQLPQLLEPQGVHAYRARNADEAVNLIRTRPIHVAVVDMYLDTDREIQPRPHRLPDGLKLLQLIQRLPDRPPAVMVVRNRNFDPRIDNFVLTEALKLNAFSVFDQPVDLEQMLNTLRRAIERYFGGRWPEHPPERS